MDVVAGKATEGKVVRLTQKGAKYIGALLDAETKQNYPFVTNRFTGRDDPQLLVSVGDHGEHFIPSIGRKK